MRERKERGGKRKKILGIAAGPGGRPSVGYRFPPRSKLIIACLAAIGAGGAVRRAAGAAGAGRSKSVTSDRAEADRAPSTARAAAGGVRDAGRGVKSYFNGDERKKLTKLHSITRVRRRHSGVAIKAADRRSRRRARAGRRPGARPRPAAIDYAVP
ncbi:hypothetical protein EVAR_48435_1 [Eumeta japonica]|uniref:Uncharacterized protein n=1 Tax=Eumeta variegata TaxID=151549 RepID=A0A4C1XRW7_EUMVA|nr:hypothetical protein EVAR_48435_1 [Eumeta japonica]